MGVYFFQAKSVDGKVLKGEVRAESESDARAKIRNQKLIPLELTLKTENYTKKARKGVGLFSGVSPRELRAFTRQLAALIESGVPIAQSLEGMSGSSSSPRFREVLVIVLKNVEAGHSLASSMAVFPDIFDRMYINLIMAGEESGSLPDTLNRLADYVEQSTKLKGQVLRAMWYPTFIILILIALGVILFAFVIPIFVDMFSMHGQELPTLTTVVIYISEITSSYWYVLIGVIGGVPLVLKQLYKLKTGRRIIDRILIGLPIVGSLIKKESLAKFSRIVSILLSSHVQTTDSFELASAVTGNTVMEKAFIRSREFILKGGSLAGSLRTSPHIPNLMVEMIHVGEETGRVDYMFEKAAEFYEDEVKSTINAIFLMIEPFIMFVLGGTIAVVIVAVYLPIFNIGFMADLGLDF